MTWTWEDVGKFAVIWTIVVGTVAIYFHIVTSNLTKKLGTALVEWLERQ